MTKRTESSSGSAGIRRSRAWTLHLVTLLLIVAPASQALASGEPEGSFLYENFVRAAEVLDQAIAAHGGQALVDRDLDIRLAFTGVYRLEGHFARPWASRDYKMDVKTIYAAGSRALRSDYIWDDGQPRASFLVVGPVNGVQTSPGKTRLDSIATEELPERLEEELEILPHEYLRQARAGAAGLRLLSGAEGLDVISYTRDDGQSRALFFDAVTHLLLRVERIDHWKHKGDRLEWRMFRDYMDRGGIQVPLHSECHVEDSSGQHDVLSDITSIEFGTPVRAAELAVPEWTLQPAPPDTTTGPLAYHDLGKGVYIIDIPESDSRSLLVAFADFAAIVEAGDRSELGERVLATADQILPGKPVRYVAMTHHHPLYANGLRPYAQRGVTILTTPGNVSYLRDLTTRPYRIHPDRQQEDPREPRIEVIDKVRIIKDRKQRLELYVFDYSTHTDEFVLPYVPSHKLIVTGDMVYALRGAEPIPASSRELAIDRVVGERKLDAGSIMQTWFLTAADSLVPYSRLQEMVRLAQAKEKKPAAP